MSDLKGEGVSDQKWWQLWGIYFRPEAVRMLFLGFSAGLPLALVFGTFSLRLSQADIDLKIIGFASWIGLIYAFKWVWSPFIDRTTIPILTRLLGRRRSWMLIAQCGIIVGLMGMALCDIEVGVFSIIAFALLVAFASATQDIALDAYRIESAELRMQGALVATYSAGYRLAMLWAGAGALWVVGFARTLPAGHYDDRAWTIAYLAMAASALVGVVTVIFSPEPKRSKQAALEAQEKREILAQFPVHIRFIEWIQSAIIAPFADFLLRYKTQAIVILLLIAMYRISDIVMGTMSSPFYNYMGYTEIQIANTSKIFGVIMTLAGTFIGGTLIMRVGVFKILFLGAVLSASTNILFALLAVYGYGNDLSFLAISMSFGQFNFEVSGKVMALAGVISLDNLSGGIASAAFIGYLSSLTSVQFSATQYALFSSLMQLVPKFIGGYSGAYVVLTNYHTFFICTALLGIPALFLVKIAERLHKQSKKVKVSSP